MNIAQMRYKDLLKKIPPDMEVEFEGKGGYVIARLKRCARKGLNALPTMF